MQIRGARLVLRKLEACQDGLDEYGKYDGELKMFIQDPLNIEERHQNLMITKFIIQIPKFHKIQIHGEIIRYF